MKLHFRKMGLWLTCLLLITALLPVTAFAWEMVNIDKTDCTLTIQYPCAGIEFRLYRVADISKSGEFTPTENFKESKVSFVGLDSTGWRDAATTLDGYIALHKLSPVDTRTTNSDGKLTFSPQKTGLYLVTWDRHTTGGYTYTPQPFLVSLPGLGTGGDWVYAVEAEPKYDKEEVPDNPPDEPDTVTLKVQKVWKDNGDTASRPSSVTVQLLKDGVVYKEVELNAANNWMHMWTGLNADHTWQVVEKNVPDGYTVSVGRTGVTFTVTNTLTPPPPPPPDEPDNPPDEPDDPDIPDHPDTPDMPDTPDNPDEPDEPDIPQTGQLWWPVPLLACGGMGLFLAGWLKRRNSDCGETDE